MILTRVMSTRHGLTRTLLALVATVPLLLVGAPAAATPGDAHRAPLEETTVTETSTAPKTAVRKANKSVTSSKKASKKFAKAKAKRAHKGSRGGKTGHKATKGASRVGFELLPASGTGYYHYTGGDHPSSDAWGQPTTIECVEKVARKWASKYPKRPRLGVGDISLKNGGRFRPHKSHRKGVDIDIRPMKARGEGPVSVGHPSYSRKYTKDMIALFIETCDVKRVYFNDIAIARKMDKVATHPGHHNHVHVTLRPSKQRPGLQASTGRHSAPAASYK